MRLILNVDDYHPSRYARTKVLQQAGFKVIEASTGQSALEQVAEQRPVLILLDVNLPDMSGFEVCRRIKADPKSKATPVLHISASSVRSTHQIEGLDSGADSYLVEPIDADVLIATVNAFLRAREAEEALQRSHEELKWFVYRVAHDLNEPLRTISIHAELLARDLSGRVEQDRREGLDFLVAAANRMHSFVADLLQYSQVTNAERSLTEIDGEALLANAILSLDEAIVNSGAVISHDPLPTLVADPSLEYLFQNLISNAIKYRQPNIAPRIQISARREADVWLFLVRDNGIGIKSEYQKEIFKVFHRLHGGGIPGNGIGLALCQKIIQSLGGTLWLESTLGVGSDFYFTLPADQKAGGWDSENTSEQHA